eukprot:9913988-Heterocapsa_arctica.AAC.1
MGGSVNTVNDMLELPMTDDIKKFKLQYTKGQYVLPLQPYREELADETEPYRKINVFDKANADDTSDL